MNTRELYTAIREHFEHEQNVVDLMRTNEWSCYLYDTFEISAADPREEFWFNEMTRRARSGWLAISEERRRELLSSTADKWERIEMQSNADIFTRTAYKDA